MSWVNLTACATREQLEQLEDWFWRQGAVSVTVEDGEEKPIFEPPPGEQPIWDEVLVTGLFEDDVAVDKLTVQLKSDGYSLADIATLGDRQWEREWLSQFKPMRFGERLWICPTGYSLDPADKIIVQLDPGLAFGTGTHETTRLCLEYIDSKEVAGCDVLDYGCGSGILAIATALKGARKVVCVDNDPQALTATTENARRNSVAVETTLPGKTLAPAHLVLANILAQPLVELAPMLMGLVLPKGTLVLSGIMSSQVDWVSSAYSNHLKLIDHTDLDGWVRLVWEQS